MQFKALLQAIRPCRESETGWARHTAMPGNHNSLALNERGPALKVFWSRRWRDGRGIGERTHLPKRARLVIERLTKKHEPEGARAKPSAPFGSKIGSTRHQLHQR